MKSLLLLASLALFLNTSHAQSISCDTSTKLKHCARLLRQLNKLDPSISCPVPPPSVPWFSQCSPPQLTLGHDDSGTLTLKGAFPFQGGGCGGGHFSGVQQASGLIEVTGDCTGYLAVDSTPADDPIPNQVWRVAGSLMCQCCGQLSFTYLPGLLR